jgi:hypothetical protein
LPQQFAVADEKHLHARAAFVFDEGNHIFVHAVGLHDFLALQHFLQGADLVAQGGGALELQVLRRLLHLRRELAQQVVALALQKQRDLLHNLAVLLSVCQPRAGRKATPHVVIQARALLGRAVPHLAARDQREGAVQQAVRLPHRA